MKWLKLLTAATLAIALLSCAHAKNAKAFREFQIEQQLALKKFNAANKLLDDKRYLEAAKAYDSIGTSTPASQLDLVIMFNAGIGYYEAGQCETANDRFRAVVRMAGNSAPAIKGRALLQMADDYTCLGDSPKTITTLVELARGRYQLPPDIMLAQVPARLAGAYARIGNVREAQKYYKVAERGLAILNRSMQSHRDFDREMARILLAMGSVQQLKPETLSSQNYLASLRAMQKYLYKAVELDARDTSQSAADQIAHAYDNVWYYIDRDGGSHGINSANGRKSNAAIIAGREEQREKLKVAELAVQDLKSLYKQHIPTIEDPAVVVDFLNRMHQQELKFRNYIATNIVGTDLTPEALHAESLKRAGRVLNPDPILEEKAMALKHKPKQARKTHALSGRQ